MWLVFRAALCDIALMMRKTNRRQFLRAAGATAAAMAGGLARARWAQAARNAGNEKKPNIVFVFIDDMGYGDLSCFGNRGVKTTHIDRLAAEGIRLTNFYVNSPICSPSRVAVTTGQYPVRHGITSYIAARNANRQRGMADWLDPKAATIARTLKKAGYATGHFGKWHMGGGRDVGDAPLPSAYGFDESLVAFEGLGDRVLVEGHGLSRANAKLGRGKIQWAAWHERTGMFVDRAIDFTRRNKGTPFYVQLCPNDVHDPHVPPPGTAEKYADATDNPHERKLLAVIAEMDGHLGRLFGEIDRLGLAADTLIVLTSDNGPTDWPHYYRQGGSPPGSTGPFFGRKWCLYEGGIRMPFVARWTGRIPAGRTDETSILAAIDLFPTFCSLANVAPPKGWAFDGRDMAAALLGTPIERKGPVFWQYGGARARLRPGNKKYYSPSLAVREGKWKLLVNPDGSGLQLFDLQADPGEKQNLAAKHADVADRLSGAVRAWWRSMPGPRPRVQT